MSLKASLFTLQTEPQSVARFVVTVPGNLVSLAPLRVSATSLPFPYIEAEPIWHLGRPFYLPKSYLYRGTWDCVYYEDTAMHGIQTVAAWLSYFKNTSFQNKKIKINLLDSNTGIIPVYSPTLNYVFLKEVEPIQLDWSKPEEPMKIKLTFQYSSIS